MSFGMVAASYLSVVGPGGLVQQNFGTWSGTTMAVSLSGATAATSTIALFVSGNTIVPTPSGWTLRESNVNEMGHYLFTRTGGTNSWNITTNNGVGTWCIVEVSNSTYSMSASANASGSYEYTTPTLTPTAGHRLLLASVGATHTTAIITITDWSDGFTEIADVCNAMAEQPMQGVALRDVSADGTTGFMTTATYSQGTGARSAIIVAFAI